MNRKFFIGLGLLGILLSTHLSCTRSVIKPLALPVSQPEGWSQFAENSARNGAPDRHLDFPLELAWIYKPNAAVENTLIVGDSALFFGTLDGYIYAVHLRTARKLGRIKIQQAGTCAYAESHLILARRYGNKTLFNLNLKTGKYQWNIDAGDIQTEPLIDDHRIYIAALYNHVDQYDFATGTKIWSYKTTAQLRSSPALSNGILVLGSDDGTIYALNAHTGELKWRFQAGKTIYATPVISDSCVFVGAFDNYLYALHLTKGTLLWKFKTGGRLYHAVGVAPGCVLVGSNDYYLYCLDSSTGALKWRFSAGSIISTTPTVIRNHVIFGSADHHLYAADLAQGALVWKYQTKGRIRTTPIVAGGMLLGASEDNLVYAFKTPPAKVSNGTGQD